jgi:hypothetical protein
MTTLINDIDKAVAYEIITAMGEEGLDALLTENDLLANMAVPVTQFDFTYVTSGSGRFVTVTKLQLLLANIEE